ncbi:MAG: hypothetical protein RJA49_2308 [Actinomycetota bacterium]|jgi:hypothetical protein
MGSVGGVGTFDDAYYRRFYGPDGAHDRDRIDHLAAAVHHMAAWWGIEIRSVLDVGAGMGFWRDWYRETHPAVKVRSTDVSAHACRAWGHEQRDIAEWCPPRAFDLVICHSVLQYIDDDRIAAAVDHLAAATRQVLYLEVPTRHDLRHIIDPAGTDLDVHQRTGASYRRLLTPHFRQVGAGFWVPRVGVPMYELEAAAR